LTTSCRHAHYSLGDYEPAASAFQKGLDIEPTNANLRNGRENALARISDTAADPEPAAAPGGNFDDVLRSLGGGAGGGTGLGGLDLAGMMQNPAIMNMAQQMMGNGGLENLMRNPAVNQMVCHRL
jgi:small glutamine-rich tetratricopeptide repeat-containing protein alpha